jgi:hypothetical protein
MLRLHIKESKMLSVHFPIEEICNYNMIFRIVTLANITILCCSANSANHL